MAKMRKFRVSLNPAKRTGMGSIETHITFGDKSPTKTFEASSAIEAGEIARDFALEHGEPCAIFLQCLSKPKPPGFDKMRDQFKYRYANLDGPERAQVDAQEPEKAAESQPEPAPVRDTRTLPNVKEGDNSPWGRINNVETIRGGHIWSVDTPSHGGIVLSADYAVRIPAAVPAFTGDKRYWEEDCDWAVPFLLFEEDFTEWEPVKQLGIEKMRGHAVKAIEHRPFEEQDAILSIALRNRDKAEGRTELTPQGEQHVLPGCEKARDRGPAQHGLWD